MCIKTAIANTLFVLETIKPFMKKNWKYDLFQSFKFTASYWWEIFWYLDVNWNIFMMMMMIMIMIMIMMVMMIMMIMIMIMMIMMMIMMIMIMMIMIFIYSADLVSSFVLMAKRLLWFDSMIQSPVSRQQICADVGSNPLHNSGWICSITGFVTTNNKRQKRLAWKMKSTIFY